MAKLNKPLCATQYGNTGYGDCFLEPSKFVGAFQVPKDFEISEDDLDDLQAFLNGKVSAGIGARIFPYHNFIAVTDNTEDITINTTDYGSKIFIRDGFYDFTFRYLKGGVQLHQEIGKNEGSSKYFLFYDDNGILYGYKSGGALKGIPVDLFKVLPWRVPTGGEAAQYLMRFIINPIYMNKGNLGFVKIDDTFNLFDIAGLQTIELTLEDTIGNNTFHISAATEISGVDIYDAYSTVLGVVGAWVLKNKTTGATIALTSVTANAGNKQFYIVANQAAMNALNPGDIVLLSLVAPTVLSATPYNVDGYESKALPIAVPAS
jgi:hypothetical protein